MALDFALILTNVTYNKFNLSIAASRMLRNEFTNQKRSYQEIWFFKPTVLLTAFHSTILFIIG